MATTEIDTTCMFPVADALQLRLYDDGSGRLVAHQSKKIRLGPWEMMFDLMVLSDKISHTESGTLVKIRKKVWAYLFYRMKDRTLHMVLFDGAAAGAKTGNIAGFSTGDIEATLAKIAPFATARFASKENSGWVPYEVGNLDEGQGS